MNEMTINNKKKIIDRLSKISGQINGIKKMIETDKTYDEIFIQVKSVDKAFKSMENALIDDYAFNFLDKNSDLPKEQFFEKILEFLKKFR